MTKTFREENRDFGELARELTLIEKHNLRFANDLPQDQLLLFAEAALVCIALERFLRMILGSTARDSDTMEVLLNKAISEKLIVISAENPESAPRNIAKIRDTLLHGNYLQASRQLKLKSVEEYFRGPFIKEIHELHLLLDDLCNQIDPETGKPWKKAV